MTCQKTAVKEALLPVDRSCLITLGYMASVGPWLPRWKQLTQTVGREIFSNKVCYCLEKRHEEACSTVTFWENDPKAEV